MTCLLTPPQLFIYLPHDGLGIGGVKLGAATPLYVLYFNTAFWSLPAYSWLCLLRPAEAVEGGAGYAALSGEAAAPPSSGT